jgi:lysozyme
MRKLLLVILLAVFGITAHATSLDDLPPLERSIRVIKFYETLHRNAGNVIGYGHVIQPGEPYKRNANLTEAQADTLLRSDLTKLCRIFASYGSSMYLLATLAYNIGPGKVVRSEMFQRLKTGETISATDYLSFCRYKGKVHPGIRRRRYVEYTLLSS